MYKIIKRLGLDVEVLKVRSEQQRLMSELKVLQAQEIIFRNNQRENINNLSEVEFKVFSQWGDDGIIQFIINKLEISDRTFVEFGVQDYLESNTRFLLINNNWEGLIMDGSNEMIDFIQRDPIYWKHDLSAKHSFITVENINDLLQSSDITGEIGLYHIDIDGNDYWVWKATSVIQPIIVIVEYQSLFGCERAITIPYQADFVREKKHYSYMYYGSSLLSLCDLAKEKGYAFIGCNSAGNNAYFIREDKIGNFKSLTAKEGFVMSKFREGRDKDGKLTFLSGSKREELIKGLPVINTRTGETEKI